MDIIRYIHSGEEFKCSDCNRLISEGELVNLFEEEYFCMGCLADCIVKKDVWTAGGITFQEDIASLLRILNLGDHARDMSPHQVLTNIVIPEIKELLSIGKGKR